MGLFNITGFQRDLLVIIAGLDQPTGQDIKDAYEDTTDTKTSHGRLYPNLDTLVEESLVSKGKLSGRKNYYEPTTAGQQALEQRTEWRAQYLIRCD